jgi:hypothetical protein
VFVRQFELHGPERVDPSAFPASHRRLITTRPRRSDRPSVRQAAEEVLRPFVTRAFRRPVDAEELEPLVDLVDLAVVERREPFERGIQVAVAATLVSPQFLFRIERDEQPQDDTAKRSLNDYELATRLSYFLWSSMPDSELFQLAASGRLREPRVLAAQVQRMLADPRSEALVENFAGQWLNLRNLDESSPDPDQFELFDQSLRESMRRETLEFFAAVMREDRPLTDLLNADYSYLNERLAQLYGVPGVEGDQFRRVTWPDGRRAGVLTHASILTLTSNPTRTSPVKRGKWIMENILGTPPPEPPANVPQLEESAKAAPNATLREQLELHRKDPTCASCHKQMDALGLALENYDAIGRWRDRYPQAAIDAAGKLSSGETFSGPQQLLQILGERRQQFGRCLAEKMLTYALGRGLEYYDRCAVDKIVRQLEQEEYRFQALVLGIVTSDPFLMRRGESADE